MDEVGPVDGVGGLGAGGTLQQQPEAQGADEEQHRLGVDVVGDRAVGDRLREQRFDGLAPAVLGFLDRARDLGLAPGGHVGFESHRLVQGERRIEGWRHVAG